MSNSQIWLFFGAIWLAPHVAPWLGVVIGGLAVVLAGIAIVRGE